MFSELRGEPVATGRRVVGTITGGTGRYAGVTGDYSLTWQYVAQDATMSSRDARSICGAGCGRPRRDRAAARGRAIAAPAVIAAAILAMWFTPPPQGLTVQAWRLFAIFAGAIVSVVANALPILTASVFAVAAAVLTGLLPPAKAYAGFANGTILLIVLAFLVARAVVKCGLGARLGHLRRQPVRPIDAGLVVQHLPGRRADRAGVSEQHGALRRALPAGVLAGRRGRRAGPATPVASALGSFLMFSGIVSLSLSSALWLTAMAANPLGAEIAQQLRRGDRIRLVAARRIGADAGGDGAAAAGCSTGSSRRK